MTEFSSFRGVLTILISRTLGGQNPVVVFINLGNTRTVTVADVLAENKIPTNARGKVLAATSDSLHLVGGFIANPRSFELGRYDAVAISLESQASTNPPSTTTEKEPETTTPDKSASLVASILLLMASFITVFML
jgi:hypothetical protein